MNETILIIEDDKDLSEIIKGYLLRENYNAVCKFNGEDGLKALNEIRPLVVILDLMVPIIDGIEICKTIRKEYNIPIIVISAKSSEADKLLLLGLGADDYLTKPFSMKELVARVSAQVRRLNMHSRNDNSKYFGSLKIFPEFFRAEVDGEEINLTAKEFKLLDFLTANAGRVFTKQQLMDKVWGYDGFVDENTVTVSIARLREKLSQYNVGGVKTVWGVGYKWEN